MIRIKLTHVIIDLIFFIIVGSAFFGFAQSLFGLMRINDLQYVNNQTFELIRDIKEKSFQDQDKYKDRFDSIELESFYLKRDIENLQKQIAELQLSNEKILSELNLLKKSSDLKLKTSKIIINKEDIAEYHTLTVTAYTSCPKECGNNKGITASGTKVKNGTISASRDLLSKWGYGTKIYIPDMGVYILEDSMSPKLKNTLDVYMESKNDAIKFGRKVMVVARLKK